jgi:hypothetical protein
MIDFDKLMSTENDHTSLGYDSLLDKLPLILIKCNRFTLQTLNDKIALSCAISLHEEELKEGEEIRIDDYSIEDENRFLIYYSLYDKEGETLKEYCRKLFYTEYVLFINLYMLQLNKIIK